MLLKENSRLCYKMKFNFTILLALISHIILSQSNLIPGIVYLDATSHYSTKPSKYENNDIRVRWDDYSKLISDTTKFQFKKLTSDSSHQHQISFYFDWSGIPRQDKIVEKHIEKWFKPLVFDINDTTHGFFDIYLTCKSKKGNWLEVIINEKTKETLWIKKSKYVNLIKWKQFTKKTRSNLYVKVHNGKIYSSNDTTSKEIKFDPKDDFHIKKVKGNWFQISNKYSHDMPSNIIIEEAWVKFKDDVGLLVGLTKT